MKTLSRIFSSVLKILVVILIVSPNISFAYYGLRGSYVVKSHSPPLHGFQLMFLWDPDCLKLWSFDLYFDAGYSHFKANHTEHNRTIDIFAIAPVLRYSFFNFPFLYPYLEASIGLSYMNRTRLEKRNLGEHFAFQDRLGAGVFIGQSFSVGAHSLHYSNAHFSKHNSGITIPLLVDVAYRY